MVAHHRFLSMPVQFLCFGSNFSYTQTNNSKTDWHLCLVQHQLPTFSCFKLLCVHQLRCTVFWKFSTFDFSKATDCFHPPWLTNNWFYCLGWLAGFSTMVVCQGMRAGSLQSQSWLNSVQDLIRLWMFLQVVINMWHQWPTWLSWHWMRELHPPFWMLLDDSNPKNNMKTDGWSQWTTSHSTRQPLTVRVTPGKAQTVVAETMELLAVLLLDDDNEEEERPLNQTHPQVHPWSPPRATVCQIAVLQEQWFDNDKRDDSQPHSRSPFSWLIKKSNMVSCEPEIKGTSTPPPKPFDAWQTLPSVGVFVPMASSCLAHCVNG